VCVGGGMKFYNSAQQYAFDTKSILTP